MHTVTSNQIIVFVICRAFGQQQFPERCSGRLLVQTQLHTQRRACAPLPRNSYGMYLCSLFHCRSLCSLEIIIHTTELLNPVWDQKKKNTMTLLCSCLCSRKVIQEAFTAFWFISADPAAYCSKVSLVTLWCLPGVFAGCQATTYITQQHRQV